MRIRTFSPISFVESIPCLKGRCVSSQSQVHLSLKPRPEAVHSDSREERGIRTEEGLPTGGPGLGVIPEEQQGALQALIGWKDVGLV